MDRQVTEGTTIRFLSFSNDKEDSEKLAKLREAASKIEEAIAREKSISELVDYVQVEEPELDIANDTRPLYERLLDQRKKKEEALEESQKLSNLVTKLDEDDATYLNQVAKDRQEEELKKRLEVYDALEEKRRFKEKVAQEEEDKMKAALISTKSQSSSLKNRLSSLIKVRPKLQHCQSTDSSEIQTASDRQTRQSSKRLSKQTTHDTTKDITSETNLDEDKDRKRRRTEDDERQGKEKERKEDGEKTHETSDVECNCNQLKVMKCIGILPSLPIVTKEHDSSESDTEEDEILRNFIRTSRRHK